MKTYRELYFKGIPAQLSEFVATFREYEVGEWKAEKQTERWKNYLFFEYLGELVDKARVSIYLGDNIDLGELKVGNIVPLVKNQLSVEEYNNILMQFYNDVVVPFKEKGTEITITIK